jgi:hypothetical protein
MGVLLGVVSLDRISLSKLTAKDVARIHWLLTMLSIFLVAMMAARFVSALIDNYLSEIDSSDKSKVKKTRPVTDDLELKRLARYDVIVSRNIFDSANEMPGRYYRSLFPMKMQQEDTTMEIVLVGT